MRKRQLIISEAALDGNKSVAGGSLYVRNDIRQVILVHMTGDEKGE